ncbi:sensor histidine kinase [Amycolatopsis sp. NPDC049868]|uniref:sensor histidine kinase n=1 Tax=Amycolatopsis sp. NPDC049868 TaxID=3363934 RepID=UPI00379EB4A2
MGRGERVRRWLLDAWPSLPFIGIGLATTGSSQPEAWLEADLPAYVLVVAASLTLIIRRYPLLCLTLNGIVVVGYLSLGYPFGPILLTTPAVVLVMAARSPLDQAILTTTGYFAVLLAASWAKRVREQPPEFVGPAMTWQALGWGSIITLAVVVGVALRVRREARETARVDQAHQFGSADRLRMAEELHDSLGHGLAVIAMQAGMALHVLDRDARDARAALEAVRATSKESLTDLRAALESLRGKETKLVRPAPGLACLDRLADRVRRAGVDLQVQVDPRLPELPSRVDTIAYQIVHESLTNVLRHAGAASARVRIACADHDTKLLLEVTDTGRVPGDPPVGAGIGSGIKEITAQAEAAGGELRARPRPGGGFAVMAWLPL